MSADVQILSHELIWNFASTETLHMFYLIVNWVFVHVLPLTGCMNLVGSFLFSWSALGDLLHLSLCQVCNSDMGVLPERWLDKVWKVVRFCQEVSHGPWCHSFRTRFFVPYKCTEVANRFLCHICGTGCLECYVIPNQFWDLDNMLFKYFWN